MKRRGFIKAMGAVLGSVGLVGRSEPVKAEDKQYAELESVRTESLDESIVVESSWTTINAGSDIRLIVESSSGTGTVKVQGTTGDYKSRDKGYAWVTDEEKEEYLRNGWRIAGGREE